ncbi:ATP-binding protein [Candidatus Pacearchaeota archaeon]|nr:ATP-binding protein [Candidatus Pacearchaeota archaeon]
MRIAITGGKGGTGKSTVATALAVELSKENKVLLIDADVDCPNDDIILSIKLKKIKDVETMIPEIDKDKCIKCGKCSQVCRENAIVQIRGEFPILVPEQCNGCKSCKIVCPVNAINEAKQKIGEISIGKKGNITLISGKIKPGIEESSLIVHAIKKYIKAKEKEFDYIIIDTAAGTHCPVIAALLDVDLGIAVTEPTPLGNHDLILILELMKQLKIKSKIVLNRSDIADKEIIEKTSEKFNSKIIAKIPYSKKIQEAYSKGEVIKDKGIERIVEFLKRK